jgi:metallophosphoesterase (TIGR03768 family)
MGTINGATKYGDIISVGPTAAFSKPPYNPPNLNRRSLKKKEWVAEFFNTSSLPKGHGFHLVNPSYAQEEPGFSCYSFLPKPEIPLRMVVLDDVQHPEDGSHDIHGHGYLSTTRVKWLRTELALAKTKQELVIIAAHIPIAVSPIGSEMEWWESAKDPNAKMKNAIAITDLITEIQTNGQVICWLAGHRHVNTIKAFKAPPGAPPESGFWQIETSSFHDFPQQFRSLQVYLNSDYSISIVAINVDPAVGKGTPAETARHMAIAAQQIIQTDRRPNAPNVELVYGKIPVSSMDPSRAQDGTTDPSIQYGDVLGVPYSGSYNAELFKPLSPEMVAILKRSFPA